MKLLVAALRDKPVPGRSPLLNVPLDKRVEYALDCIDAQSPEMHEALEFIRKAQPHLDNPHLQTLVEEALRDR